MPLLVKIDFDQYLKSLLISLKILLRIGESPWLSHPQHFRIIVCYTNEPGFMIVKPLQSFLYVNIMFGLIVVNIRWFLVQLSTFILFGVIRLNWIFENRGPLKPVRDSVGRCRFYVIVIDQSQSKQNFYFHCNLYFWNFGVRQLSPLFLVKFVYCCLLTQVVL